MRQLEYVQVLYAFHFDSLPKNGHEHEHGSYHVPWNSRNIEMTPSGDLTRRVHDSFKSSKQFTGPVPTASSRRTNIDAESFFTH
jgi:hypothetical protein